MSSAVTPTVAAAAPAAVPAAQAPLHKFAVLYVDDEETALKYFRKGLDKQFPILTAPNVAAALEILRTEAHRIGVLITDQRMPGAQGTELLAQVRREHPDIVRILVTAYADMESAIDAVNGGSISKYLTKPVDFKKLGDTLQDAMRTFLERRQNDQLLRRKMSELRRMVVIDRVRSLAEMAGGITHHLRNSMTAMTCFLEEAEPGQAAAKPAAAAPADGEDYSGELWKMANEEHDRLVQMVQRVQESVVAPAVAFNDEIEAARLVRGAIDAAAQQLGTPGRVVLAPTASAAKLRVDAPLAAGAVKTLVTYAARLCAAGGPVTVAVNDDAVTAEGTPAVQVLVRGHGPAWSEADVAGFFTPFAFPSSDPSDLGIDLLMAFFVAYHHGGDVLVHRDAPLGPGFELLLPPDPAAVRRPDLQDHLIDKLFASAA